jgi:hypothetical protein
MRNILKSIGVLLLASVLAFIVFVMLEGCMAQKIELQVKVNSNSQDTTITKEQNLLKINREK